MRIFEECGHPEWLQCSAILNSEAPVRACSDNIPRFANFFAADLGGGRRSFDRASQFNIRYRVLPGSRSGTYRASMFIYRLNGTMAGKGFDYVVVPPLAIRVTATPNAIYPAGLGLNPTVSDLQVIVTDGLGNPVTSPQELTFVVSVPRDEHTQDSLEKRGGHAHVGTRPLGTIAVLSSCPGGRVVRPIILTGDEDTATFEETTDSNGLLCMKYDLATTAQLAANRNKFGGILKIEAFPSSGEEHNSDNFANLNVRVPLVLLPDNSQFYSKIGGTDEHPGPPDNPRLDMNHWGRPDIVAAFPQIAQDYIVMFQHPYPIFVNDMSLPKGGGFDIFGNWDVDIVSPTCVQLGHGHCLHRAGTDMDLVTNPYHDDGIPIEDDLRLQNIIRDIRDTQMNRIFPNARVEIHSPGRQNQHFHINFSGR